MAAHYNTAIVPARPYRARDKAKAEVAVQIATRFVIAKLRNRQFFTLTELNAAIAELLTQINDRVTRHLGASRRALFEELERCALKPLPVAPYVFAEWKQCRAGIDYHVEVDKHYYSVPHQLLREKVWARITARTIEVFHHGKRVAAHVRAAAAIKLALEHGVDILYHCEYADEECLDLMEAARDRIFVAPAIGLLHALMHEAGRWGITYQTAKDTAANNNAW